VKVAVAPTVNVVALALMMAAATAWVTVSVSEGLVTAFNVAVIPVAPVATPVATPALLIVATLMVADAQVTDVVRFCVVLSV
jgi:hypothetical protein